MARLRSIRDLLLGAPERLELPIVLQFPVNDICNSRCQMCHIWQKKQKQPVSIDALAAGLADPLFSQIRAVGLNGGEPTLRRDLAQLAGTMFEHLPNLRNINLITNGINDRQVIERISELSDVVRRAGGALDVMVSLDGYGEVHDRVRGRAGNFESAVKVLDWLSQSDKADTVRVGCTVIRENVYGLHDLHRFCRNRGHYVKYRLGIPHKRLYTQDVEDPFQLDSAQTYHLATFLDGIARHYEKGVRQRHFYRSLIAQLLQDQPRSAGCDWKHRGATLTSRGEVLYCAVESPVIAELDSSSLTEEYFAGAPVLSQIRRSKCADCHHDYVGVPDGPSARRILVEEVVQRSGQRRLLEGVWDGLGLREMRAKRRFAKAVNSAVKMGASGVQKPPAFVICGWYGTETLGDKAILGAIVESLRSVEPDTPIVLASLDPAYSQLTVAQMPELTGVSVISMQEAASWTASARALIMGGGPLMHTDAIVLIRRLFDIARSCARNTVIAGCGVGPLDTRRHSKAVTDILASSDLTIFRDRQSAKKAADLAGKRLGGLVANDPAFAWLNARREKVDTSVNEGLLLGLRAFPAREYASKLGIYAADQMRRNLDEAVAQALTDVLDRNPDLQLRPVPMCTNAAGADDRFYYEDLFRLIPSVLGRVDWSLLAEERSPRDYLEVFRTSRAALTMRFHSLVFALHAGLPTVAIDYTNGRGKVASLASSASVPSHRPDMINAAKLADDLNAAIIRPETRVSIVEDKFASCFEEQIRQLLAAA